MFLVRSCIRALSVACFTVWWVISAVLIWMTGNPGYSSRWADLIRDNKGLLLLLCIVLLPLWAFLRPPKSYGHMTGEQRRELMRIPLTASTGRSEVSLFVETCVLLLIAAVCVFILYLAILDLLPPQPASEILLCMGIGSFYVGWLALLRIHRFIYPV